MHNDNRVYGEFDLSVFVQVKYIKIEIILKKRDYSIVSC